MSTKIYSNPTYHKFNNNLLNLKASLITKITKITKFNKTNKNNKNNR